MNRIALRALLAPAAVLAIVGCDPKDLAPVDVTPPNASITSPADGATVSGVGFLLEIDADADTEQIDVHIGSETPFTLTSAPFRAYVLTVPYAADTMLDLSIEAFDAAGNSTVVEATVDVQARTLTQLTTAPQADRNPVWSPDGTKIAFESHRNGATYDIWMMDADGANETRLTTDSNDDRSPTWSPDGDWIAWQSNRTGKYDVFRMPVATGEGDAENLTFPNENNEEPAFSPDGSWIYFASDRAGNYDIYRMTPAGNGTDQLTTSTADEHGPSPSANGRSFAFSSDLNFISPHVYLGSLGTFDVLPLSGEPGVGETDPSYASIADVILYTREASAISNVWALFENRESAVEITNNSSIAGNGGASFSPDGSKIAFHSGVSGNLDIWVLE
ncbi:MAG: PD40 domain-containing protein [Gemmatimonadetes bacterium]|nr:PD40 domain-containing protein [Gemmatimonadota bacterium]